MIRLKGNCHIIIAFLLGVFPYISSFIIKSTSTEILKCSRISIDVPQLWTRCCSRNNLRFVSRRPSFSLLATNDKGGASDEISYPIPICNDRRGALSQLVRAAAFVSCSETILERSDVALAAVGTLPEFADASGILQRLTVSVADESQQESMIKFLVDGLMFKILRQRTIGSVTDTWLGYGPEQCSIPSDFTIPMSYGLYGGHASIHLQYDSSALNPTYKSGDDTTKQSIAYLQVALPTYRISQMVKNNGNVLDAYGYVNVISPSGLPFRAIIGIRSDPIMFVAINCQDVQKSKAFYQKLGFLEQSYPYARPSNGKGQFEPPQEANSVYLSLSQNSMGVLLRQSKNKKAVQPNRSVRSLSIVFDPATYSVSDESVIGLESTAIIDPSGIPISFISVNSFEKEEKSMMA